MPNQTEKLPPSVSVTKSVRRYDLDWLRVFAVLILLCFHSARPFDEWGWHIKNETVSGFITNILEFINIWHMPLFFLLSGSAAWFALSLRPERSFAKERVNRLFIPLVFGMAVIIPPQVYIERIFRGQFEGSYFSFYLEAFNGSYPEGNLSWHHLWFLAYLFVFSLLALPIFKRYLVDRKPAFLKRLMDSMDGRWSLFGPAIPLALYEAVLRPYWPGGNQNLINDWANFASYFTIFVYGFVLVSDQKYQLSIQRHGNKAIILSIITSLVLLLFDLVGEKFGLSKSVLGTLGLFYRLIWGFSCWFWLVALLSIGARFLNFTNRFLAYSNEAVLPIYILHQTVIVIATFFIIKLSLPILPALTLVTFCAFTGSIIIYDLIVKRLKWIRVLFGMRIK
ncbi:MAG: acyltransferase family protein [Nitrospinales bacterium]